MSVERLLSDPETFDFFQACRLFETRHGEKPRIGEAATKRDEYVRFGQEPYLEFPTANLASARRRSDGQAEVIVRFLGMLGPQGPLPLAITDEVRHYALANDDSMARFLDILNRRFIQLFFRAWANSRALVQHDRRDDDQFEKYIASQIGLGSAALRDLDSVPDRAKATFAGLMGPRVKSCSRLRSVIAGLFGVKVSIEEFVGVRLMFEPGHLSRIGAGYCNLGQNVLLGSAVYSVQDKFRIQILTGSLAEYQEFLPTGRKARKLADLVFFYIGMELEWDVELALPVGDAAPVRLGQSGQLGWTTWMAPNWSVEPGAVRRDARFDLAKRFGLS